MNDHLKVKTAVPAEKQSEYTDAFFVDKVNESIAWMYYNPDSTAGGQYVTNILTFAEIRDVLNNVDPEDFFDELGSIADQELADVDSPWFEEADDQFHSRPDLMDCTEQTRAALYELAKEPALTVWQEYSEIKQRNPDRILLFQVGDFFEVMGDESQLAANALSITLTHRAEPNGNEIQIVGFPASSLDENTEKLRSLGYDVLIAPLESGIRNEYIFRSTKEPEQTVDTNIGMLEAIDGGISEQRLSETVKLEVGVNHCEYGEPIQYIEDPQIISEVIKALSGMTVTGLKDTVSSTGDSTWYHLYDAQGNDICGFSLQGGLLWQPEEWVTSSWFPLSWKLGNTKLLV